MVVIFVLASRDRQRFVNVRTVDIAVADGASFVIVEEDRLIVVEVLCSGGGSTFSDLLLDPPVEGVVGIFRGCHGGRCFYQPVFEVPVVSCCLRCDSLLYQVAVLVVAVSSAIFAYKLVCRPVGIAAVVGRGEAVADRVVGEVIHLLLDGVCSSLGCSGVGAVARCVGQGLGETVDGVVAVAVGPVLGGARLPVADLVQGVAVAADNVSG